METSYKWLPIIEEHEKKLCKDTNLQMRCRACDTVLIDRTGRKRTNQQIWQFASGGHTLGHTHESCCYMIEVPGIEANTVDPNFGKSPTHWV